ncbi:MAG: S1C family serine protease [Halanaerobiaceae bacterium]
MKNFFKKKNLTSYVLIALVALMIGLAVGSTENTLTYNKTDNGKVQASETTMENSETVVPGGNVFADIASRVDSGVVLVTAEIETQRSQQMEQFFNDPFFRYFFGDRHQIPEEQEPRTQEGFGSGFIASEDGYIVTNEHVVHNAVSVEITLKGLEDPVPAEIIWSDFDTDLAVLKIDTDHDIQAIKMGNSDNLRPGDWSIAIGNPFGFEHTVTTGVISALGRPINIPGQENRNRSYSNLIQTDAAINPGNSGGPLLNINGEVIGINTAVSLQGQGIGFAIPINEIKDIVQDLKEDGEIIQPWLGIYYGEMGAKLKEQYKEYYDLESLQGVMINKVVANSPAAEAGLQPNDIISKIDGNNIAELNDVKNIITDKEIGETIRIEIIREGYTKMIFAEVGKRPNQL